MTGSPDEPRGPTLAEWQRLEVQLGGKVQTVTERTGWSYWLLDTIRIVAGIMITVAFLSAAYVWLYDPLSIVPGGVDGTIMPDGTVRMYLTGSKTHDRCPVDWRLTVQRPDGNWDTTEPVPKPLPVGLLNKIPIDARFANPLSQEEHKAQLVGQYYCLLTFRHQFNFTLDPVKENDSDADPNDVTELRPRYAQHCPCEWRSAR